MAGVWQKLAARAMVIAALVALVALTAYVRGDTPGETFATRGIDLKIDSKATYNGAPVPSGTWRLKNLEPGVDRFFNFDDIKPGDYGENTISFHVKNQDAWMCLDFSNLESDDNGQNEPESHQDANGQAEGELADGMEFFAWHDDGDNIYEIGEEPLFGTSTQKASEVLDGTTYPIGDAKSGRACKVGETRYIGIYWCAGDLSVDTETATLSCSGLALGNSAQTDSLSVDVSIRAFPVKDKPKFTCDGVPPPDDDDKPGKPGHDDDNEDRDSEDRPRYPRLPRFDIPGYFDNFPVFGSFFRDRTPWWK